MKRTSLFYCLLSHQIQAVFLTRTWLNGTFDNTDLILSSHFELVLRRDQLTGIPGGVVILKRVSSTMQCRAIELASDLDF